MKVARAVLIVLLCITVVAGCGKSTPPDNGETGASSDNGQIQEASASDNEQIQSTGTFTVRVRVEPPGGGFVEVPGSAFRQGTAVTITARANAGYMLDHWSGDVSGCATTVNVLLDSDKNVVAYFAPVPLYFTAVRIYDVLESSATINWKTNVAASAVIRYGLTDDYGLTVSRTTKSTGGWEPISSLAPATSYHFRITAIDELGNQAVSDDFVFTTLSPKGTYSARLFPFLYGGSLSSEVDRLNTSLFNGSTGTITITKIQFVDHNGYVVFTLPPQGVETPGISRTPGRDELPEVWADMPLEPGTLLFTGIEVYVGIDVEDAADWLAIWYFTDSAGQEQQVVAKFSIVPWK